MKKCYIFLLALIFFCEIIHAQKRNNVWAFGNGVGLNFNTSPVSLFKSKLMGQNPPYYISSICSKEGGLLFYTDGLTVWNKDGFVMPKYNKWWPWYGNVIPLVTPHIANDSLYYYFGIDDEDEGTGPNSNKLQYFSIKIYNPGDIEEVVYPRPTSPRGYYTTLLSNTSHVLAGTIHCNQIDTWITTHSPGALYSFLVTASGVNTVPVITTVSEDVLPVNRLHVKYGNIKFSANSERLVVPDAENNKIAVFDFDNQTGKFSNPITLSILKDQYLEDVEISADGSKLYFGSYIISEPDVGAEVHYIYQMDLNAGSPPAIEKTMYQVNAGDRVVCIRSCSILRRTMQLGPDGKIYINRREYLGSDYEQNMAVIDDPSKAGKDCHYSGTEIDLKKQYKFINYNYIRSGSFSPRENSIQYQRKNCVDQPVELSLIFNKLDSVKWDFGDPPSGSKNFSTQRKPLHQYPGAGSYLVKAIIYDRCFLDTAYSNVVITEDKIVHAPDLKDTVMCKGGTITIDATIQNAKQYKWEDGSTSPVRTIDKSGTYTVTVVNDCSSDTKSFNTTFNICPCNSYIPNVFSPNYDGLNDKFTPVFDCFPFDYQFKIYDRYGSIVFESNKMNDGWNGRKSHSDLPIGIYVWTLQYRHPGTKELVRKKGMVTLLR
jgi:gliding motility-associated-like protein